MAVRFEGVSYRYPGGSGVFDVDLEIADGELLAVIGPSGSGKSTLLKLLAGFLQPDAGRIWIDGRDATRDPPQARGLGVVPQFYALFPHMSVAENVAYPLKVRGVPRQERLARAREALARVGLPAQAERTPGSLSGGQQQRVALARALVFGPSALLLDEPLSALDAALRVGLRDEIRRVQREAGVATLHITHDQEEALSIADRVAVVLDGRLAQVDRPTALYDHPVDTRVARFVGEANLLPGVVVAEGLVETRLGNLRCATGTAAAGQPVTLLIRPESLDPHPPADAANRLRGSLGRDRFLGASRRYDLTLPGGLLLGETLFRGPIDEVAIPPEAIRLLPPAPPTDIGEAT